MGSMGLEALGLDATAGDVYQAMLRYPRWGVAALACHLRLPDGEVRAALDQLAGLALLRASRDAPGEYCAVSPGVGLAALLRQREADLARRQHELAASHAALARMVAEYAAPPAGSPQPGRDPLVGLDAVQGRLEHLAASAEHSCLSVMPGGGQSRESMAASRPLDEAALRRGVAIRTLYQDSVRNDTTTYSYALWLARLGGHVRTSPLLPPRMLIIDAATAIVPLDPGDSRKGAVEVTAPGVIAALTALFEQAWQQAAALGPAPAPGSGPTPAERALVGLLTDGLTDEAAAKRLGISLRTERRMIAGIMERLDVTSRFAAGARAAQRGWL
jgi:DNA-binding CsgD family transcriptional regulator/sugar-specific transcriptional regulator TrmB